MVTNEKDFFDWIDAQLAEKIPNQIVAFNINIYDSPFKIDIVGSNEFDIDDEDWACNEDWVPQNRLIFVSDSIFGDSWIQAQENLLQMAKKYINSNSTNSHKLTNAKAFTIGFVDGNLDYITQIKNRANHSGSGQPGR